MPGRSHRAAVRRGGEAGDMSDWTSSTQSKGNRRQSLNTSSRGGGLSSGRKDNVSSVPPLRKRRAMPASAWRCCSKPASAGKMQAIPSKTFSSMSMSAPATAAAAGSGKPPAAVMSATSNCGGRGKGFAATRRRSTSSCEISRQRTDQRPRSASAKTKGDKPQPSTTTSGSLPAAPRGVNCSSAASDIRSAVSKSTGSFKSVPKSSPAAALPGRRGSFVMFRSRSIER
mmetsp:Transcript_129490/g.415053  ORF Transcript_129490/g.415053 Transcript_129490/m.415053 type:complete len:228 (-) Transcript_129490:204-887(-)